MEPCFTLRIIKQFAILVSVCFVGEILHELIPLPVPASIYGLVIMFALLQSKIMPLDKVEEVSDELLGIMPLLFIPSTVGLVLAWDILKVHWLEFTIIGVGSTIAVFFVSGHVTQLIIRLKNLRQKKHNPEARPCDEKELQQEVESRRPETKSKQSTLIEQASIIVNSPCNSSF